MPELSRFFGIVIQMYQEKNSRHHLRHFHARYQEFSATYQIDPLKALESSLPQRQRRLVEAWAELHREELLHDWNLLISGKPIEPIKPLE